MAELPSTDRNLLIALLAFQNNFIDRPALLAAFAAWTENKSRPIAELLVEQKLLSRPQRQLIEGLAAEHLKQHANDPQQTLAALTSVEAGRDALATLPDNDLRQSLIQLSRQAGDETLPPATTANRTGLRGNRSVAATVAPSTSRRFHILRPHAEGGLGKVSVARDEELHREVALKEIKPKYADEPSCRARFTLEAEITGGLEHPGIVPVYSLGVDADGRPYYAMRFIRGDSLKEAIESFFQEHKPQHHQDGEDIKLPVTAYQSLEFRQLLGRFVAVCNAVAYAHSRGVLHRDLKPGNIMLGDYGETLVVDWGLAKATGKPESTGETPQMPLTASSSQDSSGETLLGSAIGTFAYMSPEQSAGRIDEFGPATDIYLLGATLYHLLTGHPPHRGNTHVELRNQILTGTFPRPCEVNAAIPAPLAAICLKAMSLASRERYGQAAELAQDVEFFLADERVTSYVEPLSVRIRRWLRKHPKTVATVAATLLVSVASSVVIAGVVASNAQIVAGKNSQLARQNEELVQSNKAEKDAKEDALAVIGFFQDNVLARARPEDQDGGLGIGATIRDAIDAAEHDIATAFHGRPLVEASLRNALGNTYFYLGEPELAIAQHEVARQLRETRLGPEHLDTLSSMTNLATALMAAGELDQAIQLLEQSLELNKVTLGPEHLETLTSMNNLASAYKAAGKLDQSVELLELTLELRKAHLGLKHPDVLAAMGNLAVAYQSAGKLDQALPLYEQTLELKKVILGPEHPDTLTAMNSLATALQAAGKLDQALPLLEQTLEFRKAKLGAEHPSTLTSMNNLAHAYRAAGKLDQALPLHEQALTLQTGKLGPDHPATLLSMNNLAIAYAAAKQLDRALPLFERTLALRKEKLGPDHPETLASMGGLAGAYKSAGKLAQALPLHEETLKLCQAKLGLDHPYTLIAMNGVATAYHAAGKFEQATALLEQVLELQKSKLGADHPETLISLNNLGMVLKDAGKLEQSRQLLEEALDRRKAKLGPDHPNTLTSKFSLAEVYLGAKQFAQADPLIDEFVVGKRRSLANDDVAFARLLANIANQLAKYEHHFAAEKYLRQCLAIRERQLPDDWSLFNTQSMLGAALTGQQKFAEAEPLLLAGYEGLKQRRDQIPAAAKAVIPDSLQRLVALYTGWQKPTEAAKWQGVLDAVEAAQSFQ